MSSRISEAGRIGYRPGPAMASADELRIKVTGRGGHAGVPWRTVDPVTTAAQIVLGLQTVVSRRTDLMKSPTVVSVTTVNGGLELQHRAQRGKNDGHDPHL